MSSHKQYERRPRSQSRPGSGAQTPAEAVAPAQPAELGTPGDQTGISSVGTPRGRHEPQTSTPASQYRRDVAVGELLGWGQALPVTIFRVYKLKSREDLSP